MSSPVAWYLRLNASCLAMTSGHSSARIEAHFSWFP